MGRGFKSLHCHGVKMGDGRSEMGVGVKGLRGKEVWNSKGEKRKAESGKRKKFGTIIEGALIRRLDGEGRIR